MKKIIFIIIVVLIPLCLIAQPKAKKPVNKKASTEQPKKDDLVSEQDKKEDNVSKQHRKKNNSHNSNKKDKTPVSPVNDEEETTLPKDESEAEDKSEPSTLNPVLQQLVNNMVYVSGGTFNMGATASQSSEAANDEYPVHRVTLSSFSIGKYEVTQEEWETVMASNPSHFKGKRLPVENVSWDDCQIFIRELNRLTGKTFRLPTEAEWEYAARGIIRSKDNDNKFSGGNNVDDIAWYSKNSSNQTHEVGGKSPNKLGLYDMSGNVWEWCEDWYASYKSDALENPSVQTTGDFHVSRGGSFSSTAISCRASYRHSFARSTHKNDLGLRLVY